ncbi:unnamed protein product [Closterium sp. NIES-53]
MSSLYLTDLSPSSLFPPSSLHPLSVLSPSSLRPPSSDFPLVPPPSSFIPPPPVLLSSSSFFRRDPARGGECKEGNQGGGQEGRSGISQVGWWSEANVKKGIKEVTQRGDLGSAKVCGMGAVVWWDSGMDGIGWAGLISEMLEEAVDDVLDTKEMEEDMEEEVIATQSPCLFRPLLPYPGWAYKSHPPTSLVFSAPFHPVQAGLISEMLEEAVDDALDTEEMEDEMEEEVNKVLDELATEATAQLPTAVRQKQRAAEAAGVEEEDERVPQMEMGLGADDEAELARLKAKYK